VLGCSGSNFKSSSISSLQENGTWNPVPDPVLRISKILGSSAGSNIKIRHCPGLVMGKPSLKPLLNCQFIPSSSFQKKSINFFLFKNRSSFSSSKEWDSNFGCIPILKKIENPISFPNANFRLDFQIPHKVQNYTLNICIASKLHACTFIIVELS
jgi:hypothetical protein